MNKVCSKCNIKKDESLFRKTRNQCKDCISICKKQYNQSNKENIYFKNKQRYQKNKKVRIDSFKQYYQDNKESILINRKEHYQKNKDSIHLRQKEFRQKNKENIHLKKKEYYQKNKKVISARNKQYRKQYQQSNRESINSYRRKYEKNRLSMDPIFKLRKNCSRAIRYALKDNKKNLSILDYLPYTIQELKEHLAKQFEPWMNWDNYGICNVNKQTWQIDHIIPQSFLPYLSMKDDNFKKCWGLDNLRPLESMANSKKSNKIILKEHI